MAYEIPTYSEEQVECVCQYYFIDNKTQKEIAKKFAQDMLFNGQEILGIMAKEARDL